MEAISIALILIGIFVAVVASFVLLVRAFQTSILWGLGYIFVPFVSLIFLGVHWERAKGSFFACLLGAGMVVLGLIGAGPNEFKKAFAKGLDRYQWSQDSENAGELDEQILDQRSKIEKLEGQFQVKGSELAKQFQALDKRRKELKKDNAAQIEQYNVEAAAYTAQNTAHKALGAELESSRQALARLLDERSTVRANSAPVEVAVADSAPAANASPNPNNKQIVMYTTSTCPACVSAKHYLSRKGLSYDERNVERSTSAAEEFRQLGGRAVPLIVVGNERMVGLNPSRLDQILAN